MTHIVAKISSSSEQQGFQQKIITYFQTTHISNNNNALFKYGFLDFVSAICPTYKWDKQMGPGIPQS